MLEYPPPTEKSAQGGYFTLDALISGIIHNLNNPLTILKVRTQLLLTKFPQNQALQSMIDNIGRIESILSNIATKFREEQNENLRLLSLNTVLNIELKYLEGNLFFKHHVQKNVHLQEHLPFIRGTYRQISQGFLAQVAASLLNMSSINSRQLSVSTFSYDKDVVLEITDNGNLLTEQKISDVCSAIIEQSLISTLPEQLQTLAQTLLDARTMFGASCREQVIAPLHPIGIQYRYFFDTPKLE